MAHVMVKPNESIESALRRFKKQIQESGVLKDAREHEHYEKPSERRRKAAAARLRKIAKAAEKEATR
jgi:small subunit ribosomal protein S21